MRKVVFLLLLAAAVALFASGCATDTGSREYIPGKGWVPVD